MKNKKKKITQFLKQWLLLIFLSFSLYNCEKEESIVKNEVIENQLHKPYTLKKIKYKDLAKDASFAAPFNKLQHRFSKKNTTAKENKKELSIRTDEIAKIEIDNTISWTFELENKLKEASIFENLLVKKHHNEFSYFLISYQEENNAEDGKNTKQSVLYTLSEEEFNLEGIHGLARDSFTTPEDEDSGSGGGNPCNGVWQPEYNRCDAGGDANGHSPQRQWNGRYCSGSPLIGYIIDFSHCTNYQPPAGPGNTGNNNDETTGDNNNGTTGGGSSNNNDNSNNGSTVTTPIQNIDGTTSSAAEIAARNVNRALGNTLSLAELEWLSQDVNLNLSISLESYLFNNNSDKGKRFTEDAIKFLKENPNYSIEQYKNWFDFDHEGIDYEYDAAYWENPNLSFPPQDLPSWNDFNNAFPRKADGSGWLYGADNIYPLVGGDVLRVRQNDVEKKFTNNTCALKVSIALNGSGVIIPEIITSTGANGKINYGTIKGADGKNYFLNAQSLNKWMKLTFGTSPTNPKHFSYTAAQGGIKGKKFPRLLGNKKGIFSLNSTATGWASGHIDILFETLCASGCHYNAPGIISVDVWVLD